MTTTDTPRTAAELLAELQAQAPSGAHPAMARHPLPEGVQAGHAYAYLAPGRAGVCWAQADGTFTTKAAATSAPATWATSNAPALRWTHATLPCGCGQ